MVKTLTHSNLFSSFFTRRAGCTKLGVHASLAQVLKLCVAPANGNTDTVSSGTETLIVSETSPYRKVPGDLNCPLHQGFFAGRLFTFCKL